MKTISARTQTILGLIGYLFIGTAAVLLPSVMPSITNEFTATGLTLAAISLIFPARAVGGLLGNLLAGIGSDRLGRGRLVWLAALLLATSLALAAWTGQWWPLLIAIAAISGTQGALSTGINALVADANPETRARALNSLHGVYGIGAAISPLVIGALLQDGLAWRWALGGSALIWLLYAVAAWWYSGESDPHEVKAKTATPFWRMLRHGPFLALFFIAFAYNGVAWSLLGWIALFMQQSAGFSTILSLSMISVFYVALTVGRFLCAAFAERAGYGRTLFVLAIGIAITYPLVVLSANPLIVAVGVFLTGLSLSGLFPMALAFGTRLYPAQAGAVSGVLSIAMTFGSMVPPLWTGIIADRWSFQTALGVNYVMVLPLIFIALYLRWQEKGIVPSPQQAQVGSS
ncbi:MAG: MFS transporter [Caldilineaceae bacterium]|nr:MFS transporter [Caldilineaceae bacterium]